MKQSMTKPPTFGVPSLEVADRIDDSNICSALTAAHYRFVARMSELERQFEAEASKLRRAYLAECETAQGGTP